MIGKSITVEIEAKSHVEICCNNDFRVYETRESVLNSIVTNIQFPIEESIIESHESKKKTSTNSRVSNS